MIAIVDYGVGNLFSVASSFKKIGEEAEIVSAPLDIQSADRILLPGVGAFGDASRKLRESGLEDAVKEAAADGKPLMGVCLGMQLLFEKGYEYGEWDGLGLIPGCVVPMKGYVDDSLKIPQIGWNPLCIKSCEDGEKSKLFKYINDGDCVYFVHSYYAAECDVNTIATVEYDKPITAAVQRGNVFGCQFHPEKSGEVGLKILKAFCEV